MIPTSFRQKLLCERLMKTLSKPDDEDWTCDQTKVITELIKIAQSLKIERYLDCYNSVSLVAANVDPKLKIPFELILRYYSNFPPAQVHTYLLYNYPLHMYAPKRPFNLPIFFYQSCPSKESIIEADCTKVSSFSFKFPLKDIHDRYTVVLNNKRTIFTVSNQNEKRKLTEEDIGSFGVNQHFDPTKEQNQFSNSAVQFDDHLLYFEDGKIRDETSVPIPVYLNNMKLDDYNIKKAVFYKVDDRVELFLLFDRFFMARGCIQRRGQMTVCDVTEIPGSFGTTDFECSPDFKSMIRISHMNREKTIDDENTTLIELKKKEKECIRLINSLYKDVQQIYEKRKNDDLFNHENSEKCFIDEICALVAINMLVFNQLKSEKSKNLNSLTYRERIHWIYHLQTEIGYESVKINRCENGKCHRMFEFFSMCETFINGEDEIDIGLRVEFGKQLFYSLKSLYRVLMNEETPNMGSLKIIKCEMNPINIYSLSSDDIFTWFPLFPKHIKPMALDVICQNSYPESYDSILNLYGVEDYVDENEKKFNQKLVLDALKKHPYILLFSSFPIQPKVGLLKEFGKHMLKLMKNKGFYKINQKDDLLMMENNNIELIDLIGEEHLGAHDESDESESENSKNEDSVNEDSDNRSPENVEPGNKEPENGDPQNEEPEEECPNDENPEEGEVQTDDSEINGFYLQDSFEDDANVEAVSEASSSTNYHEDTIPDYQDAQTPSKSREQLGRIESDETLETPSPGFRKRHGAGSAVDIETFLNSMASPTQRNPIGKKPHLKTAQSLNNSKFVESAPDYLPNREEIERNMQSNERKRKSTSSVSSNLRNRPNLAKKRIFND